MDGMSNASLDDVFGQARLNVDADAAEIRRWETVGDHVSTIADLNDERLRVGFVPMPFKNYVEGLARVVGCNLERLLSWLSISGLDDPMEQRPSSLAKLAHGIGLSAQEALTMIRIAVAEQNRASVGLILARRRNGKSGRDVLDECEDVLRAIEARYPSEVFNKLRITENAFADTFARLAPTSRPVGGNNDD